MHKFEQPAPERTLNTSVKDSILKLLSQVPMNSDSWLGSYQLILGQTAFALCSAVKVHGPYYKSISLKLITM